MKKPLHSQLKCCLFFHGNSDQRFCLTLSVQLTYSDLWPFTVWSQLLQIPVHVFYIHTQCLSLLMCLILIALLYFCYLSKHWGFSIIDAFISNFNMKIKVENTFLRKVTSEFLYLITMKYCQKISDFIFFLHKWKPCNKFVSCACLPLLHIFVLPLINLKILGKHCYTQSPSTTRHLYLSCT